MIPIKMPAGTTNVVTMRRPAAPKLAKIERIGICRINVGPNPLRPLDEEEVKRLAVSMKRIGLMTPITVRYYPETLGPDGADDGYKLIAGRHRYAAAVSLGWDEIDAIEVECSDVDAKLWEIAENLHRAELTQLERDEQIAMWIELTDASQPGTHQKAGQQPGGVNAAARDLGIKKTDAHRAVKVASLSDEAKAAAREHGLDNNRSAMLEAAREKDHQAQVDKIVARANKKTTDAMVECCSDQMSEQQLADYPSVEDDDELEPATVDAAKATVQRRIVISRVNRALSDAQQVENLRNAGLEGSKEIITLVKSVIDAWKKLLKELDSKARPEKRKQLDDDRRHDGDDSLETNDNSEDETADHDEDGVVSDDEATVAEPAVLEDNIFHAIGGMNENARVFNKLLKVSAVDREAVTRINTAISRMIGKWQSVQSGLLSTPQILGLS
jgi:ParB/RepB/Spo0J family partition protein